MSEREETLHLFRIVGDAIRGGCPELFEHPYEDFPDLVATNVLDALQAAGWSLRKDESDA